MQGGLEVTRLGDVSGDDFAQLSKMSGRGSILLLAPCPGVWAYVKDVLDRLLAGDRDYAALRPDR